MATPTQSPLECRSYFVTQFSVTANPEHDFKKEIGLGWEDIQIESTLIDAKDGASWQVNLSVKQNASSDKNSPYNFTIEIVGLFRLLDGFEHPDPQEFERINGSSYLFGTARELLRNVMSAGPFVPLMLPTVSFFVPKPKDAEEAPKADVKKAPKKRPPKKTDPELN